MIDDNKAQLAKLEETLREMNAASLCNREKCNKDIRNINATIKRLEEKLAEKTK